MPPVNHALSTGLPSLDRVLRGVMAGDNIVWRVDDIEDYAALVTPYARAAVRAGRRLVYLRFASHRPLLSADDGAEVHELRPEAGFETFLVQVHAIIEAAGRGAFYVLDGLSELAADWYSDQMLGNFFMLTCPYLYDLETVTYFALFRNRHSPHALQPIAETTQLLLDVYRHDGVRYVRPVKVQHRTAATLHELHAWGADDSFAPMTCSAVIAEVLQAAEPAAIEADRKPDVWTRAFDEARAALAAPADAPEQEQLRRRLHRMAISREEAMTPLVARHLDLADIAAIRERTLGTGLVGGKTVGMLLAHAVLRRANPRLAGLLERHDSFYVGSDVFYTFLVRNGIWWIRQQQRDPRRFLEGAEQARRQILTGTFPDYMRQAFGRMLDYFGQAPIIVRSSSLLEDNYGNAFAGKYESVFCANQGPRDRRLEELLGAIRTVYASTMSENALRYRADRGLLERDEQMALLIMRVSGARYGRYFFPPVAGVGFSFNPYAWNPRIDPDAGVLRLVFGLGTRAVDRTDDDHARLVALNAPDLRPETNFDEVRRYTQRRVDTLDLEANRLDSVYFEDLAPGLGDALPMDLFATRPDQAGPGDAGVPALDGLLRRTPFVDDLREILATLEDAYANPVDIEFTVSFPQRDAYRINLVQCRPLQVQGSGSPDLPAVDAPESARIIEARGAVVGRSRVERVGRFVVVDPEAYAALPLRARPEVARLLGELNRRAAPPAAGVSMLTGPGRWGTRSPDLGVPVHFAEINRFAVVCEIVGMREGLVPDVSLGTHFLNELVEMDMLYLALRPGQGHNRIDTAFFAETPNRLLRHLPDAGRWTEVVRVLDLDAPRAQGLNIRLLADAREQRVLCYRVPDGG